MVISKAKGYAKINLTLDVVGKKDGFHLLDSVCKPLPLCDKVYVRRAKEFSCNLDGVIPREKNTAVIAARLVSEAFNVPPVRIYIKKKIPFGYGVGGSSADAVATVKAMKKLYNVCDEEKIKKVLSKCGSDALMQYSESLVRMQGFGEKITPLDFSLPLEIVLAGTDIAVSSKECYAQFDKMNLQSECNTEKFVKRIKDGKTDYSLFSNDLLLPAVSLEKDIEKAKTELKKCNPLAVNMTGSGCAFYGIFKNKKDAKRAERKLKKVLPFAMQMSI